MALNGDALGLAIKAAVEAAAAASPLDRTAMFRAMGNAIVDYLKSQGLVTITQINATPSSVSGVTTAGGTPITGVATGVIT